MSTRTIASKIDAHVEQMAKLEELASMVQGSDEASASLAAVDLDKAYREWYASALTLLPDDLKERFRFEYEGDLFRDRVKHFLSEPRDLSVTYPTYSEDVVKMLNLSPWQHPFTKAFQGPLRTQKQILIEARARFGFSSEMLDGLQLLDQVARRLPVSFAVLGRERQNRSGIEIADEYDVQRVLHAICAVLFEEVEDEDPTPKMAGVSSRLDFILARERIAVETKFIGGNLTVKKLQGDLAKDMLYFRAHPDAGSLFIFVYDPSRKIMNPAGFERGLYSDSDNFPVRVVVVS